MWLCVWFVVWDVTAYFSVFCFSFFFFQYLYRETCAQMSIRGMQGSSWSYWRNRVLGFAFPSWCSAFLSTSRHGFAWLVMTESVLGVSRQILDCCYAAHFTCVYEEYVLGIQDFHKKITEFIRHCSFCHILIEHQPCPQALSPREVLEGWFPLPNIVWQCPACNVTFHWCVSWLLMIIAEICE